MGHKVYIFPILLAGGNSRAIGIVDNYGDDLVAIDWYEGYCYCQDDCTCMQDAPPGVVAITRDSAVDALPSECEDVERRKLKSRKWHK